MYFIPCHIYALDTLHFIRCITLRTWYLIHRCNIFIDTICHIAITVIALNSSQMKLSGHMSSSLKPGGLASTHTSSKPRLRALRLQRGGGCASPQPPPLSFFSPGRLASKHTSPFQTHAARIAFANGGGCAPPPTPPLFVFFAGWFCFSAYESLPNPCCAALRLQNGVGYAPPNPPPPPLFLNSQRKLETLNPKRKP